MADQSKSPSVEELLSHAGWMRGLARGIVGDAALAEDIVQDAFVAALNRPLAAGNRAPWPAWLRGVVSNLARNRRRRECERAAVERRAARPEASDGDLEALELVQLQRELTEHLLLLREPHRSAVILRHIEGLGAEAIAKRCGCSPEAARQRVARGLAELRARLAASRAHGGRDWLPALCALSKDGSLAGVSWPLVGVTVMSKSAWTLVSVGAGLLAGLALWSSVERRPAIPGGTAAQSNASDLGPQRLDASSKVPTAADRLVSSGRAAAPAPEVATTTTLLVRDVQGEPVASASVGPRGSSTQWDTTDQGGRLELRGELAGTTGASLPASVSHEDFVDLDVDLECGRTLEVVLARKPQVEILLHIPSAIGGGVPKAPWSGSVWVRRPGSGEVSRVYADFEPDSAGSGRLVAKRLPLGRLERAEGRAGGFASGASAFALELEQEALTRVDLELTEGKRVVGRVIDAFTRDPIPRAVVWAEEFFFDENRTANWTRADELGRFELSGLEGQRVAPQPGHEGLDFCWVQVSAKADGFQGKPFEGRVLQANAMGEYEVELKLHRSDCRLRGRVIGVEGLAAPLLLMAVPSDGQVRIAYVDADGSFELDQLVPGMAWLFASNSHTFNAPDPSHSDPRACARGNVALAAGETKDIELDLERGSAKLSGRVLDARGQPIAGIAVRANMNERRGTLAWGAFQWLAESAQDGAFAFEGLPSGSYAASNREILLETGTFLESTEEVRRVVVGVANGSPVYLRDVAEVIDGGDEPTQYVSYAKSASAASTGGTP